ncbi:MAG: hypothetical protein DMF64_03500 [Acidobacteria bacterium]|nr:MAG: hypothetical protein DMF64_03500 [Acidobacteriota bacterium]
MTAAAQRVPQPTPADEQFGPVVRAYLGYLRAEQEVVDDRISRREISAAYYRRNSNRIRALRQMALQIARAARNDYLPELEAVAGDELNTLFESPPAPQAFHVGAVLDNTFRYLGLERAGETFYLFARLDPYEQADLIQQQRQPQPTGGAQAAKTQATNEPARTNNTQHGAAVTRPRRTSPP